MPASNRTSELALRRLRALHAAGIDDDRLLLEALLRRGFLAIWRDDDIWVPRGPHAHDLRTLARLLEVEPCSHPERQARLAAPTGGIWPAVEAILGVPEHRRGFMAMDHFRDATWARYRTMAYGHSVSVGPCDRHGGLDLGVALLVKALPLVRVRTDWSCDGHGGRPARVSFPTVWDAAWCRTVFEALAVPMPDTRVSWGDESDEGDEGDDGAVSFEPVAGYDDEGLSGMLEDLQRLGRRLLDGELSEALGAVRRELVAGIPWAPKAEYFGQLARLAVEGRCGEVAGENG